MFLYFHTVILRDRQKYDYVTGFYRIMVKFLTENTRENQENDHQTISEWFLNQIDQNYFK